MFVLLDRNQMDVEEKKMLERKYPILPAWITYKTSRFSILQMCPAERPLVVEKSEAERA